QGWYNYLSYEHTYGQMIRGLTSSAYLKGSAGMLALRETATNDTIRINQRDREGSVFLSLGDNANFRLLYSNTYKTYDTTSVSNPASLWTGSRHPDRFRGDAAESEEFSNIASPYISLKNFIAAQYGDVNNVKWLNTGYCG